MQHLCVNLVFVVFLGPGSNMVEHHFWDEGFDLELRYELGWGDFNSVPGVVRFRVRVRVRLHYLTLM